MAEFLADPIVTCPMIAIAFIRRLVLISRERPVCLHQEDSRVFARRRSQPWRQGFCWVPIARRPWRCCPPGSGRPHDSWTGPIATTTSPSATGWPTKWPTISSIGRRVAVATAGRMPQVRRPRRSVRLIQAQPWACGKSASRAALIGSSARSRPSVFVGAPPPSCHRRTFSSKTA